MFAFQLWREFKLSLAEIHARFPTLDIEYVDRNICIIHSPTQENFREKLLQGAKNMGGIIKLIELIPGYRWQASHSIMPFAESCEWKFRYGISLIWIDTGLKEILQDVKRFLQKKGISARFVNKNFQNLNSAQILSEQLIERQTDYSIIESDDAQYFWKTIWVQDIDAYSKRDYGKTRDMQVGMLPPKLAQIMVNIAQGGKKQAHIYDPFCGLGTILIESALMWNTEVYGSDISPENTKKSQQNINFIRKNFDTSLKTSMLGVLDARWISSSPFLKKSDILVTEWYLGKIFHKYCVTEKKLQEEKKELSDIYAKFFYGLQKANYSWVIVISFPFWEIRGKYHYFSEIYDIIEERCKILPLLPQHDTLRHTRSGSLLYKRPQQIVWREIFKLRMKKIS